MQPRFINYQHLYYFWATVHYGGVTKASIKLKLAQPTISAQLKTFEDTFGEKLFQKDGRNLKLTEAGKIAHKYADRIFSIGQELIDVLDGRTSHQHKEFKIGISDVVPKTMAYRLIKPAIKEQNNTTIVCLEDKTERLLAELAIGDLDLVIADRPISHNSNIKAFNHFMGDSSISFLCTANFKKLYQKNFPLSLDNAPMLIPTLESTLRQELEKWFRVKNIKPNILGSFQDSALMKIAASDKKGIIPVPTVVASEIMKEYGLINLGTVKEVKESLYLISLDRRLKHPIILDICSEGQKNLFMKNSRRDQ